ncbi:MAG: DUF92 domain-containing protein [Candidatus Poseidoniaceae archaeon]|tara:strand:+ start:1333 stop:2073 length:741 start_codon:yes stop_codon:yes gene_type:complete
MMDIMQPGLTEGNLLVTFGIVSVLVLISEKYRVLDRLGVYAAAALGLVVGGLGHWTWLVILLGFLGTSHKATKWRFDEKAAKGLSESSDGHRSWGNVVANGGLPGLVAIISWSLGDHENGLWIFAASVAVAASDTFASEIGCLDERVRMITTMKKCEAGLNGGFSPNGQIAAFVGSSIIAVLAFISDQDIELAALVAIIGWLGCQVDSVLGALLENRGLMTKGTVNAAAITSGIIAMWLYLGSPHL